jgi:hypothetical protein
MPRPQKAIRKMSEKTVFWDNKGIFLVDFLQ